MRGRFIPALLFVIVPALLAWGCSPTPVPIDDPSAIGDEHLELPLLDTRQWIERHDPERAFPGYNLMLYRRRVPMLLDNNGRIVHVWPRVRATGRIRLDQRGQLLAMGTDDRIKVFDWSGLLLWAYELPADHLAHHDVIRLANGNILVLGKEMFGVRHDVLLEVDAEKRIVWSWRGAEHLDRIFPERDREMKSPSHINSVFELGPNRSFDSGDERFRPGNILVSARNLDAVFIIDRRTGEAVWTYSGPLDRQHEAMMIPAGGIGAGNIVLFDNGLRNRLRDRQSRILVIDPISRRVVWQFRDRYMYSSIAGSQQPLANGNLLISSSHGGRVLEVTPDEKIVWQWIPPWLPMRAERYPLDHCPQLAVLERPIAVAVPPSVPAYISRELYKYAVSGEYHVRKLHGAKRQLVSDLGSCRELLWPPGSVVGLSYGLDPSEVGDVDFEARVRFELRMPDGGTTVLHEGAVGSRSEELWQQLWLPLPDTGSRPVRMCIAAESPGGAGTERSLPSMAVEVPLILGRDRPRLPKFESAQRLTDQERELREKQLRALGYVE